MADHNDGGFKVIDRRPFTAEGEMRKEVVEEQEREAKREEVKAEAKAAANEEATKPAAETPKRLAAFENLIPDDRKQCGHGAGRASRTRTPDSRCSIPMQRGN